MAEGRGPTERLLLYVRTVRQLKPAQVAYLPLRRLQLRLPVRSRRVSAPVDPARAERLAATVAGWGPPRPQAVAIADAVLRGSFRFLNHEELLPRVDWTRRHVSHLWSYNLHYFDYARDLAWAFRLTGSRAYADRFTELALGWVDGTRYGRGDGWEPYALSLRVVNWIQALLLLGDAVPAHAARRLTDSLLSQLEFLERRLELHIQANHLQKNVQALAVGGLFFGGPWAERWRRRGAGRLWAEVLEQVLPDGCHYERAPMYHAVALGDLLETVALYAACGEPVPAAVLARVRAMAHAFGVLSRPDGRLHLFNDSAHGIAPGRWWLDMLSTQLFGEAIPSRLGAVALPDGGYYGWADTGDGDRLLVDCGLPGPTYQPGHAHCDLLSYELDLAGRPVVVDAGVSGYDGDPLREYVRSTRAHNTVAVAEREQSEVWGTFRVGRRARPLEASGELCGGEYRFTGAYAPYHGAAVVHARTIRREGRRWIVTDHVQGAPGAPLRSFVHLHPDFTVEREGEGFVAHADGFRLRVSPFGCDGAEPVRGREQPAQGWHCPEFGVRLPATVLELAVDHNNGRDFGYIIEPLA